MTKQVHVNAYIKKDGTQVREHFRNIDDNFKVDSGFVYPNDDAMNSNIVLSGGVSKTEYDVPDSDADIRWEDVIGSVTQILPLISSLVATISTGNREVSAMIQPQIQRNIKLLDDKQNQMSQVVQEYAKKLAKTNDRIEYANLYKILSKKNYEYKNLNNLVSRLKAHVNSEDYTNSQNLFINPVDRSVANTLLNTFVNTSNVVNGVSDLSKDITKFSYDMSKAMVSDVASFFNNKLNSSRPEAHQFMNLSLHQPSEDYTDVEFDVIPSIFNEAIMMHFRNKGENLIIPKDIKGLLFNETSQISQKLSESAQFQSQIINVYTKNPGKIILNPPNGEFNLTNDSNLQYAIGHYSILNPRIDSDGYFRATLYDIYDFDKISFAGMSRLKIFLLNNLAWYLQNWGVIENFYVLIPIKFKW